MAHYLALTFDVPVQLADETALLLHDEEANGVELRDGEVLPPPGMAPPPPGRAIVVGYFDGEADGASIAERVRRTVEQIAEGAEVRVGLARLEEEAWAETWKLHFRPIDVGGKLWIVPPWEKAPKGVPAVVIEPGMAFGTGGHATTVLCLQAVVDVLSEHHGRSQSHAPKRVLDVGCGSGILGIAARLLGASTVVMIDNDSTAVEIAGQNAQVNGCPDIVCSATPVEELKETFDLVLANILSNTLIDLASPIARRVAFGGDLFLSGILQSQAAEVVRAYQDQRLHFLEKRSQGEWVLLRFSKKV